jgi:ABC-type multidrug transport system ATPase subunit
MAWFAYVDGRRSTIAPGVTYVVGRDASCDIVVTGNHRVSRKHLTIDLDGAGETWAVKDVSANRSASSRGFWTEGSGRGDLVLLLGGSGGPVLVLTRDPALRWDDVAVPAWPADGTKPHGSGSSGTIDLGPVVRYGRAPSNDVVIDSLLASPNHAHVLRESDGPVIVDLASARGTYVNGERVKQRRLRPGDRVTMGGTTFVVSDDADLQEIAETSGVSLEAHDIRVEASGVTLIDDISLTIAPRSLVAVVGPSGSGKSTLLGALTGLRPAQDGAVLIDGQDLYAAYADWRYRIGFVPQQDLVPPQLTVKEALSYAAKLRFPSDTTAAERSKRIDTVLEDLRLSERAHLRIDRLSGGQRKRVSVALELLTRPPVLFLDEPTSGLDPGLDRQLMLLLRELADDGRTVLVVTHAMDNLELCDQVLVLAAGGHVAYFGPPADAPAYFRANDWAGIFMALEAQPGVEWARRFRQAQHSRAEVSSPATPVTEVLRVTQARRDSGWRQWSTLVARTWRVTISDRAYLGLLIALPIILAGLGFLVGNASGLGPGDGPDGLNPDARILLLILILGAAFTGAATSIQELVKERVIYQRERAVGLSRGAYVVSKALVLGCIAAVQGVVFALLTLAGRPGPDSTVIFGWSHGEVALIVGLLAVVSCMLGLALSAVIPTREATLPVLVIVTMVQIVLSGAIPLRWSEIDDILGLAVPAHWAFNALAALTDLSALLGPAADTTWDTGASVVWTSIWVLVGMAVALVVIATLLLRRSDPGRRSSR